MRSFRVAAFAATCFGIAPPARGDATSPCSGALTARAVLSCALELSPEVRRARLERDVVEGQRATAETLLPQRPVLSLSGGHRWAGAETAFDWYVTLSQEIEVAGQRGLRLEEVDAASAAAIRRVSATEHEVAADALSAYWRFVAGRQRLALAREAAHVSAELARLAQERRKEALLAPVDADIAESEAIQIGLRAAEAARVDAEATAELAALLNVEDPGSLQPGDELTVAPVPDASSGIVQRALVLRGDLAAAESESRGAQRHIAVLARERVPNITLSATFERDGFAENFFGIGLSMPIPLPSPVVPNGAGELAVARARGLQAETTVEAIKRRVVIEVRRAIANERTTAAAVQAFTGGIADRARADLDALGDALTAGRMSIRETLLAQRSLIELLASHLEVRLQYSLARIELMRAAGLPLVDGGTP